MMENKAHQLLREYRLRWSELHDLSHVEKAALVAVAFCENELNCLTKLLISSMNRPKENLLQEVSDIQRNTILRVLTAKLFEFLELYRKISSSGQQSELIKDSLNELKLERKSCQNHPGYKIATVVRNEHANHFGLKRIIQRSNQQVDDISCSSFIAEQRGNSFYPYAENTVFNPDPAGRLESELEENEARKMMDDWIDWVLKTTDLVRSTHNSLFKNLISLRFPERSTRSMSVWYDPLSQGDINQRLPLFFGPRP